MEQSGGRSRVLCWELVGLVCFAGGDTNKQGEKPFQTRKNLSKQGENTFQAREKHQQARETPFEHSTNKKNTFQARSCLSSKGYLPIKCRSLQVVGVFRQGKAVVSDGG